MTQKKGSILITALITIALCTTLALYISEKATSSYASVMNLHTDYQGAIYAMTAAEAINLAFKYDTNQADGKEDIWNNIVPIPVDKGFLTVFIKPLNAKFPLNALSLDNQTVRERYEEGYERLIELLEVENNNLEELKNWVGSGVVTSERFDENNGPYNVKGARFNTLAELLYVQGFENDFKVLSQHVSIGETGYKININLASEEVMRALLPELDPYIGDILSARDEADFKNISEVYNLMGTAAQETYNKLLPFMDVKSNDFYVKIELNVLDEYAYYHILFRRNGRSIKAVKYIEGGNIEYF